MVMLKFLKWFFGLFTQYAHPFERKVDRFFRSVKSSDNIAIVRNELLALMKENLIVVNVWMEKKYKGYKYLKKRTRKKMYEDIRKIEIKLDSFTNANPVRDGDIKNILENSGLLYPSGDEEKIRYISAIMEFLQPGKYYHYIKTASFGKLLRDPDTQKMEGDCNQIVTLYIYLFSRKFPIEDLKIKLLPEHVCLHFRGIDIECTNSSFQKYEDDKQILPVTEIISTNMLDLSDFREDLQRIPESAMLKSAQLAYAISSNKELVSKNLDIAYRNMAIAAMNGKNFTSAIFYLSKIGDEKLLNNAYKNASIYFMQQHDFSKAAFYADKCDDSEIIKIVKHNEGIYYYQKNNPEKALSIFTMVGDEKMKKACYGLMYNNLVKTVSGDKTIDDVKRHKSTYQKMLDLAVKMGDFRIEKNVRDTLNQL